MVRNITYQQPIHQEENTPLVTILDTRTDTKQSTAVDSRKSPYVVDLTKASFGGTFYPQPGSQWYLKKVSGVWALMARAPQQNPQISPSFSPQPGETYFGQEGTSVFVGDVQVNGTLTVSSDPSSMVGEIRMWPTVVCPTNWHFCDGSSLLRSSYPDLSSVLIPEIGVVTVTIATPAVVSFVGHGLSIGDKVFFTTTGSLPTGISDNFTYWVISSGFGADSFQISDTQGGSAVNSSGSQSGVHTLFRTYYGVADSTHFNVPDYRGLVLAGRDSSQVEFAAIGMTGGEKTHAMTSSELVGHVHSGPSHTHSPGTLGTNTTGGHTHTIEVDFDGGSGSSRYTVHRGGGSGTHNSDPSTSSGSHSHTFTGATASGGTGDTGSSGSGVSFNLLQPYSPINFIIRLA